MNPLRMRSARDIVVGVGRAGRGPVPAVAVISLSESLHDQGTGKSMQFMEDYKCTLLVRGELNHRDLPGLDVNIFGYEERLERHTVLGDQADVEDRDRNTLLNGELLRENPEVIDAV